MELLLSSQKISSRVKLGGVEVLVLLPDGADGASTFQFRGGVEPLVPGLESMLISKPILEFRGVNILMCPPNATSEFKFQGTA